MNSAFQNCKGKSNQSVCFTVEFERKVKRQLKMKALIPFSVDKKNYKFKVN